MAEQGIPVVGWVLNKIIGTRNDRFVKRYTNRVELINAREPEMRRLTDQQIRGKLAEFRARFDKGEREDSLMVEVFAVAREGMDRAVGIRNIFNPDAGFDPSKLPPEARAMYDGVQAHIATLPDAEPNGDFLGCTTPIPAWRYVDIPVELYEAVRVLYPQSRPPFRARPFDVQLIGSMVLCQGKIAEMKTGEGKTIVAPLACYMAAAEHSRVHVVTVNDYLVQRDRDWTFPFFWALGMTVGAIHPMHMQNEDEKRRMYRCDVTYGTTAEFGFDYLRDNMKRSVDQQVQRRRQFAIVDEVDSILIDEARTPLIISGQAHNDKPRYELADRLARHLLEKQKPWAEHDERVKHLQMRAKGLEGDIRQARDKTKIPSLQAEMKEANAEAARAEIERNKFPQYYEVMPERKQAFLTHDGVAEAQRVAGIGSFYVDENMDLPHLVEQSVRAHAVYQRDKDYVVIPQEDQYTGRAQPAVVIVDTNTGRPMVGRQWSDGLHQAVECKEKVNIKEETQTVATITIQNYYKMYKRLAGMTGTADTEAQEFHDIYKLDVVAIPTNRPLVRGDYNDLVFLPAKDKWNYITDEIKGFHDVGRPILVGTTSVEKSEMLGQMLMRKHGVPHEILNAKQHEREAHIVENAGQIGAVMIATNMAGRGTDIKLGKVSREQLLDHWLRRGLAPRTLTVDASVEQLREAIFRKIAPQEIDIRKKEAEEMPIAELELKLLRAWAMKHTLESPKTIEKLDAPKLRKLLDESGRFLLHNLRWFESIEDMGGLHVIGTERHEARRIDNQLRGRSGRQGDNGSSRFFVSLEDDLMKMFAGETTMKLLGRMGMKEGESIEHSMLSKSIENAQRKVEERNFQIRKQVLEYDEVMEHQRQTFYGLRQRVLEGRDVKGLLLEWIRESVQDSAGEYLDADYTAQCISDFANAKLGVSIDPKRFKGKEAVEMDGIIREEARADARQMIEITLGEYMPAEGSEIQMDFDASGLINWAKNRFGVEITEAELHGADTGNRYAMADRLHAAACEKIDATDLSGLEQYLQPGYGVQQLINWAKSKLTIDVTAEEIAAAQKDPEHPPTELIMKKAEELYLQREVVYPVEMTMEIGMIIARRSPAEAFEFISNWANQRLNAGWTPEQVRTMPPNKVFASLRDLSEKFVKSGKLDQEIDAALAIQNDDELDAYLKQRYNVDVGVTELMRFLEGEERANAVRSRVENILRTELLQLERMLCLETLDSIWKDHLYAMDQLRDSIGFRAFSQLDPRTEYKREGSRMFRGMLKSIRERVTDMVFKAKLTPQPPPPPPQPVRAPQVGPMPIISGPGLDGVGAGAGGGNLA
ncbi:MAG: preprotein translocase subunit SecA [Phycisphaeraceae bacterium]|nr:preprotein translocase subunit SecA [Phycisphaeraceae bacterium]